MILASSKLCMGTLPYFRSEGKLGRRESASRLSWTAHPAQLVHSPRACKHTGSRNIELAGKEAEQEQPHPEVLVSEVQVDEEDTRSSR